MAWLGEHKDSENIPAFAYEIPSSEMNELLIIRISIKRFCLRSGTFRKRSICSIKRKAMKTPKN